MLKKINMASFGTKDVLSACYCMYDEVNQEQALNITEWILSNNLSPLDQQPDVLNLIINSPGGAVSDAFAIIDMMNGSSIPVRTIGVGEIASAGLLIFMSGQKGFRVLSENTSILSHQFSGGMGGKKHDLLAMNIEHTNLHQRLLKHMAKCTGLSTKDVDDKLMPPSDVWLTAKEALKLGLCDTVSSLK